MRPYDERFFFLFPSSFQAGTKEREKKEKLWFISGLYELLFSFSLSIRHILHKETTDEQHESVS